MDSISPLSTWETGIPRKSDDFVADMVNHYREIRRRMAGVPPLAPRLISVGAIVRKFVIPPPPAPVCEPQQRDKSGRPFVRDVIRIVAAHYGIPCDLMLSPRRTHDLIIPRHVAMYLAKEMTTLSIPAIGRRFGDRDHTTILHAVRKIRRLIAIDPDLAEVVAHLRRECTPPPPPAPEVEEAEAASAPPTDASPAQQEAVAA